MDNFPGLFGDGRLENLDPGTEAAFSAAQGPNTVSVSEMGSYGQQPFPTDINASQGDATQGGNPQQTLPNMPGSAQKMTMGTVQHSQQTNQSNLANFSNQSPGYQYNPGMPPQQSNMGQFQPNQFQSFPGQDMYAQNAPMQPKQTIPGWRNSPEAFTQVPPGNYPQSSYPISNSQPSINSFQNQNVNNASVNSPMQPSVGHNYQQMPQQNMNQGYPNASQSLGYQGSQPPYPGYDPQRPMGSNSPSVNTFPGAPQSGPQGQPPSYPIMQNSRQPYHIVQYASQGQVTMPQVQQSQQPLPPQQSQIPPHPQQQSQQMLGPRPQGDVVHYSISQVPNGSGVYRAPFPQVSPQLSPRPQLSPMPRSMSPHARPNSNIAMTSPVSSPATIPPSLSPNPNGGAIGPQASLPQLDNVKPNAAGRNTPTTPPSSTQQPMQSPVMYSNNASLHSPIGQRAPMSPGIGNIPSMSNAMNSSMMQARPPMSPQHWQQVRPVGHQNFIQPGSYNQGTMNAQRVPVPVSIPHLSSQGQSVINESLRTDSISSVSEPKLNSSESVLNVINGPVISNVTFPSDDSNIEAKSSVESHNVVNNSLNGNISTIENTTGPHSVLQSVPPSSLSPIRTQSNMVSSVVTQISTSGNVPQDVAMQSMVNQNTVSASSFGSDNEITLSSTSLTNQSPSKVRPNSSASSIPGVPMPSVSNVGNTMARYTAPQGSPYVSQGYRMLGPRGFAPQGQSIQGPATRPSLSHVSIPQTPPQGISQKPHSSNNNAKLLPQNVPNVSPHTPVKPETPDQPEAASIQSSDNEALIDSKSNLSDSIKNETQDTSATGQIMQEQALLTKPGQQILPQSTTPFGNAEQPNPTGPHQLLPNGPIQNVQSSANVSVPMMVPQASTSIQGNLSVAQPGHVGNAPLLSPTGGVNSMNCQPPHPITPELLQVNILPSGQQTSSIPGMMNQHNQNLVRSTRPMVAPHPQGPMIPAGAQGQMMGRPIAPAGMQPGVAIIHQGMPGQGVPIQPHLNLSIDIQQCQKQLQQLYKMQQNLQTQQKINELQQRLTQLQQQQHQQQQHFLQNQALYQSQQQTAADATADGKGKKKSPKARQPKDPKPKTPKPKKETKTKEVKPKKETKPKVPKEPKPLKEPRPKKEKVPKSPKEPKPIVPKEPKPIVPKEKKPSAPKKSKKKPPALLPDVQPPAADPDSGATQTAAAAALDPSNIGPAVEGEDSKIDPTTCPTVVTPLTATKPKSEKKKVKNATPAKKKPAARFGLNFKKKSKKKRVRELDYSDNEGSGGVFNPKQEEDDANKRRSGRLHGSRKKYVDELDLNLSDDDNQNDGQNGHDDDSEKPNFIYVDPNSEDTMPVQLILALRMGEREVISESEDEPEPEADVFPKKEKVARKIQLEEYFVKYKAFSYLHCEWRTEEELLKGDKRIQGKIKRFKQKRAASQNVMDFLEDEAFNPDYMEVDRILDLTESTDPQGKKNRHYLAKWKALAYDEATWETEEDIDKEKIELYNQFKDPPPKTEWKCKKRPKGDEWVQIDESPIYKNNNQLRDYQLEGLNWLNFSYFNGHNCILADEMGLGKTIQSLTFIECIYKYGIRGPFLIIAPLSTIPNWQREFEGWVDLNVIIYHGSQASRSIILDYEMYYKDENGQRIPNVFKFNVLITTFEIIIQDSSDLKDILWRCCIIDEAHRLKNRNCKLLEGLRMMNLEHRVLLSGTPLQNNVNELFSLLNFLEPTQFACQETFLEEFGKLHTEDQVKKLQALLKPMMLRRMKEDVEKSLAPKEETIVEVELTNIQKKYYRAILERNFDFLIKGATYTNVPSLMNAMMELRKCCLHPYLLNGAEDAIQQDFKDSHPVLAAKGDLYHNALIQSSGKMVLVDKLLPKLRANGHRVLIFSQMVKLLDILEDYLIFRKYPYERIDGRIRGNLRQAAIDRFCKPESDRFVFLLCTKAGGLGINLTAADTVIIYDSDWNPQNDLQAQARCHRIGQQKRVKIYRLLCRSTYEREMFDKASLKLGLDKAVLQSMNTEVKNAAGGNSLGLSKKDIEDLLKKGAYGAVMDEDNQGDKFCEEDIDQILSRRTTVIQLESEKGSTFSKASFSASTNRSDIDLDDPDFWKKWAKRAEVDLDATDSKKQLIVDEPRRRSQIRRYGHDEALVDCSDLESSGSETEKEKEGGEEDLDGDLRLRTRGRGRGRGGRMQRNRVCRYSRLRPPQEEEVLEGDSIKYGCWARSDCFKVEKGLLTFGWGRWKEIFQHGEFRPIWKEEDLQNCARMVLLFCIKFYRGDDKIKGFIFDLIAPTTDGKTKVHHNHIGLSAPVPRGRKGKKKLREAKLIASHMEGADWAKEEKFDADVYLDQGYSRHLTRHANKVLLRVRLLFYIKQEIIGDLAAQIEDSINSNELPIHPPPTELPPKPWWDIDADIGILVGVYKHGYERYNVVRNDPCLPFLAKCGPPDKAALMAEMTSNVNEDEMEKDDKDDKEDKEDDSDSNQTPSSPAVSIAGKSDDETAKGSQSKSLLPFPTASDINGRLRRLVTSYQRNNKKIEMRKEANVRGFDHYLADKLMRRERMAEYIRERELRKADYNQRRWSNREQAEFYRTISTFGVEYIRKEKRYDWNKFRMLSRLEKRLDENLTEYFRAFMAMCKRQCGIRLSEQENAKIVEVGVDRLPEERARRVLERVDLLNRLRNDVLPHPDLPPALQMALPSKDLPDWWIPGKHDLDLIKGVARHGLGRTDYYILYDPDLCFREILRRHTAGEPLITKTEKDELYKKYYDKEAPQDEENKKDSSDKSEEKEEEEKSEKRDDNEGEVKMDEENKQEEVEEKEEKEEEDAAKKQGEEEEKEEPDQEMEVESEIKKEQESESQQDEDPEKTENDSEAPPDDAAKSDEGDADVVKEEKDDSASVDGHDSESEEKGTVLPIKTEEVKEEKSSQDIKEEVKKEEPSIKNEEEDNKMEVDLKSEVLDGSVKKEPTPLANLKNSKDQNSPTTPGSATPLLSLQQMDEAMAKFDPGYAIDSLAANEPTVAQLLAQSAANPIKWPKDRYLQFRLEHIMYAVEHKKWPVPIDFQSADFESNGHPKCDTPPSNPLTPTPTPHHSAQEMLMLEAERKRRRQMEEVERAHLHAMLHPNLHHNLGLSKASHTTASAAAAAAAALGINPNSFTNASLRSFLESTNEHDKKSHSTPNDSHAHALRQLQALQGSLDLTIKPVSSSQAMDVQTGYLQRRGPGRPRLDEAMLRGNIDKRRLCESPQDKVQDRKRRKLNDIVLGLSSKTKGPEAFDLSQKDPLSLGSKEQSPLTLPKGSSVTLLSNKDNKSLLTSALNAPKLSSSVSITPTSLLKQTTSDSKADSIVEALLSHKSSPGGSERESSSKPGLVKSIDLPPGISLPPGIELYRPTDSTKVDKWLEQHQTLLSDSSRSPKDAKRRKVDIMNFDWNQFSGDEHVSVVHGATGHKLGGDEAPKLKHLAQWLMDHPGYDVDPQWAENHKDRAISSLSDIQRRLGHDKKQNSRPPSISSPLSFGIASTNTTAATSSSSSPSTSSYNTHLGKNPYDPRNLLQGLDPKNPMSLAALASIDPKFLASLDPKLLSGLLDPKSLNVDPKLLLAGADPKMLSSMGIDPKLLGLDMSKAQEAHKPDRRQSPAPSPKSEPKPSTSYGFDPKLLGLDPKLLAGIDPKLLGLDPKTLASNLDPKLLGGLDPKLLGLDPKLLMAGLDPKLLAGLGMTGLDPKAPAMDPKLLAAMGMDPMMMMAGFGGLPAMAGLGMANPLLAGLQGFGIPGMHNLGGGSSKSKDNQRNAAAAAAAAVAASQANLFSGMFGGAGAGLMYPPLGLGGLGSYPLSQMTSGASALLNGLAPSVTATAGNYHNTSTSSSSSKRSDLSKLSESRRGLEGMTPHERELHAKKERLKEASKTGTGLSKEERNLLRQMKAERLSRGTTLDLRATSQLPESMASLLGQLDLTIHRATPPSSSGGSVHERDTPTPVKGSASTPQSPEHSEKLNKSAADAEEDEGNGASGAK